MCTAERLRYMLGSWALLWVSICEQKLQHSRAHHRHQWDLAQQEVRRGGPGEIRVVLMGETWGVWLFYNYAGVVFLSIL